MGCGGLAEGAPVYFVLTCSNPTPWDTEQALAVFEGLQALRQAPSGIVQRSAAQGA